MTVVVWSGGVTLGFEIDDDHDFLTLAMTLDREGNVPSNSARRMIPKAEITRRAQMDLLEEGEVD